jgi:antitoxin ParD1/3/4
MSTMNVSLTPQLEKLVQDRVKSGRYTSASEVIREALRLLETHDRAIDQGLAQLRADVDAGLRQLDEGQASPFDQVAVERVKRRGRENMKRNQENPRDK